VRKHVWSKEEATGNPIIPDPLSGQIYEKKSAKEGERVMKNKENGK
jgi:hypothetical protein